MLQVPTSVITLHPSQQLQFNLVISASQGNLIFILLVQLLYKRGMPLLLSWIQFWYIHFPNYNSRRNKDNLLLLQLAIQLRKGNI